VIRGVSLHPTLTNLYENFVEWKKKLTEFNRDTASVSEKEDQLNFRIYKNVVVDDVFM
jgi:hypothetical protein